MSKVRETSIIVGASHADSIAVAVENNGRRYNNIQLSRVNQESACRFPDTESVLFELGLGRDLAEHHLRRSAQNRNKNALVCAPSARNDFSRIDLVVHRQVAADRLARVILREFANALTDNFRCCSAFRVRQIAPLPERVQTKRLCRCGHESGREKRRRFPPVPLPSRRSRTGATGGVNRGRNRLTVETALLKCCRQVRTPR